MLDIFDYYDDIEPKKEFAGGNKEEIICLKLISVIEILDAER